MAKYINLDKINDILNNDEREVFSKHQVSQLLNSHNELVIPGIEHEVIVPKEEYKISKNNIKDVLKEAGRYDDICNILNDIISGNESSYPVDAFMDSGYTKWRVNGKLLRTEASEFLKLIDGIEYKYITKSEFVDSFLNLGIYVKTKNDMLLHNYAIAVSHGNEPMDMEKIKPWQVLDSIIMQLRIDTLRLDNDTFYVPDGWKK